MPKVYLHASHEDALKDIQYRDLKKYEAPRERSAHENPEIAGGVAKEGKEIGGDMGTTAPGSAEGMNKKASPADTGGARNNRGT